ncbi:MAG: hypothetical protein GX166_06630 [Clostridiaceae bacterium]|nr:hypothetical protein [Clostridiaceae bacterium]
MRTEYWAFLDKYNVQDIRNNNEDKHTRKKLEEILTDNYKQIKSNILNLPHRMDSLVTIRSRFLRYRRIALIVFALFVFVVSAFVFLFRKWPGIRVFYYRMYLISVFAILMMMLFPTLVVYVNKVRGEMIRFVKYIIIHGEEDLDLPIPNYLRNMFVPFGKGKEKVVLGKIRCECQSEGNMRLVANTTYENEGIPVNSYGNVTYLKAQCLDCGKEHVLFDINKHGWNGYVRQKEERMHDSFSFVECPLCRCLSHSVHIAVHSPGKEMFIRESFLLRNDGSSMRESDWVNAFSHISIFAICSNCRKRFLILDRETM